MLVNSHLRWPLPLFVAAALGAIAVGVRMVRRRPGRLGGDRVSDLDVWGHKFHVDEKGNTRRVAQTIDTKRAGDWGADPVGDGTFRMVPSGDIVSFEERTRRLKR